MAHADSATAIWPRSATPQTLLRLPEAERRNWVKTWEEIEQLRMLALKSK